MLPRHTGHTMEEDSVRARLVPLETEREVDARSLWQRRGITLLTVDPYLTEGPEAPAKNEPIPPPRWWTREFLVYFVVLFTIGPYMVYVPMRLSTPEGNANFDAFANRLVPGWMQGRMRDNSDYQYRLFRDYLPMIFLLMGVYSVLAWTVKGTAHVLRCTLAQRFAVRQAFWGAMGVVCVGAMHGSNAPKLLALALGNYVLARQSTRLVPWAARSVVWVYNCAMLFLVFYTEGVPYARISPALAWLVRAKTDTGRIRWAVAALVHQLQLFDAALCVVCTRLSVGRGADRAGRAARARAGRFRRTHAGAAAPTAAGVRCARVPLVHILPPPVHRRPDHDL